MTAKANIAIIGGGIAGLSAAWALQNKGAGITLFEAGEVGQGCSHKAAGMITPISETHFGEEKLLKLFLNSLALYPEFVKNIEKASGLEVDFHQTGSLLVAIDPDDEKELQRLYNYQKELDLPTTWLTKEEVLNQNPFLSPNIQAGIRAHKELFLSNRKLIRALKKALQDNGAMILENQRVEDLYIENEQCKGVVCAEQKQTFEQVVVCSGLQNQFPSLPHDVLPALHPVKGQALCLKTTGPYQFDMAVRTIHRYPVYLVPRADGHLIVGATMEDMGYDETVTAGAMMDLLYATWRIFPASYEFPLVETWAGLRPATNDRKPVIGPTRIKALSCALGLYRHGFLLAPMVGKLIAEVI